MTREETIKWLKSLKAEIGKSEHRALWHYAKAIDMAIEALKSESIFSADRPRGEWINKDSSVLGITYECSNCGRDCVRAVSYDIKGNEWKYNFCPNCGADMRTTKGDA